MNTPASLRSDQGGRNALEQVAALDWIGRPESSGPDGRLHWNTHLTLLGHHFAQNIPPF